MQHSAVPREPSQKSSIDVIFIVKCFVLIFNMHKRNGFNDKLCLMDIYP